ncbi:hypothetical protein TrST_g10603 [Triparma strigata]|uniref:Uncharacterized protein n=1 Tax=Triparma strigata TaxID=1606541 RepID=A0A9W7EIF5_9STRA|nr:hypothetical protein TrST_g10603 [Triparma strigata]
MKFLPPAPGKALIDRKGDNGGLGVVGEKGVDVTPQAKRRTIVKIKGTGEKRGRSTSPHGGPVLKYNDLKRMQHRFENASVAIESILAKKDGQGEGEGEGRGNDDAAVTSLKIASQLNVWKDDVARLLLLVDSHIARCKKLQDHEVHMSHQNKDSPADVRRKRVNEFVLSLKADLRALHGFISKYALQEEFEANGGAVEEVRPSDVHEDNPTMYTKGYWSEKGLELEEKLREIMPIEPKKERRRRAAAGGEGEEGSVDGSASLDGSSVDGSMIDDDNKAIKASQVMKLFELRQSIMYIIVEHFQRVRDDMETDFDGGTDSAVTTILRSDKDKREMSAYIKSFLKLTEQADEMGHEAIQKFSFTGKAIREGFIESMKVERLRKEIAKIQYESRKAEHKMAQSKRQKDDYNNVEIRRGLLQRWRVQMDEFESALKTLLARERDREDRAEVLEKEEAKYSRSIELLQETAHSAAENHEQNLKKIHPKILEFIEEGYMLKEKLEALLLNVNLTTGLFKKREHALSAVEQKITKTRSARAQIELERRKSQLDFATLNVDSKRNAKILEVALSANERVKVAYREHSHTLQDNVQEVENLQGQLDKANKERESYEQSLKVKKEALYIKKEEKEVLEATIRRMNSVLVNVADQCDELMEQFNDQKMLKLKNIIAELKVQDHANAKAKEAVDRAQKKIKKLEDFLKVSETKLHGYLDEYDDG